MQKETLKGKYEYLKRVLSPNDYKNYQIDDNDEVFITSRKINNGRENFEIHYDTKKQKITVIYLVK
ncbi:MAG: hypothetical protein ACOCP8_02670 [archaeon]